MKKETYCKSPHYFIAHLYERWTTADGKPHRFGKPYPITCDGITVNVYGFQDEQAANSFDQTILRSRLSLIRERWILIPADTEEDARRQVAELPYIKGGAFWLNEEHEYGPLEDVPSCPRMYCSSKNEEYCGKPENEHGDGSIGGCIIDNTWDQDDDVLKSLGCPLLEFYEQRRFKRRSKALST